LYFKLIESILMLIPSLLKINRQLASVYTEIWSVSCPTNSFADTDSVPLIGSQF
jgi:hypothetical protein